MMIPEVVVQRDHGAIGLRVDTGRNGHNAALVCSRLPRLAECRRNEACGDDQECSVYMYFFHDISSRSDIKGI